MYIYPEKFDVIVIGGGHAGCEAALAAARMLSARKPIGSPSSDTHPDTSPSVLLLTMNLDSIALMSCNPAIGGLGKGQIVREIDALGGEMAKVTDRAAIQFRVLNRSKGPAVQSPRAQCDRTLYRVTMKNALEKEKNLRILQAEVVKILTDDNKVIGVMIKTGTVFHSKAVIVTTGTFLRGVIHIGLKNFPAGRFGEFPAEHLSESLRELGFEVSRLKTCTPPRINSRTVEFSKLEVQYGDEHPSPFSHFTTQTSVGYPNISQKQLPCWITYTNKKTHEIIKNNLSRSPLYTGMTKSIGPRYCPSIEEKVVNFEDKDRHQVFLEPEGYNTAEMYCNGLFTSLSEEVQEQIIHSLPGCENAQIMRYGYGIEYDFCQPTQLKPTLETKNIHGLYFAGQINGTTGYEEAAAQGLVAGINAVLKLFSEEPFVLRRDEAYISVLIDDLVTKGVMDPYRMFTSRAEFRLLLRSDNADLRLLDYGYKFGLIPEEAYRSFCRYRELINKQIETLEKTFVTEDDDKKISVSQLIRRGLTYKEAIERYVDSSSAGQASKPRSLPCSALLGVEENLLTHIEPWSVEKVQKEVEIEIKYAGYIKQQLMEVEKFKKLESKKIPPEFDYDKIRGLLKEAQIKLKQIRPQTIGQAARISGITPADIAILLIHLR
ncbi:MAG: tRNA uridine-5-carboxymethylaminomethyl(34) synthesis enzyme MnmG [Elusimicrobiota bacterium]|nr:tRNA uridine-5-carboxymethylaminomethyl(34) synthesis enzyme MnmG [Elusimicrobiota bacterium]